MTVCSQGDVPAPPRSPTRNDFHSAYNRLCSSICVQVTPLHTYLTRETAGLCAKFPLLCCVIIQSRWLQYISNAVYGSRSGPNVHRDEAVMDYCFSES